MRLGRRKNAQLLLLLKALLERTIVIVSFECGWTKPSKYINMYEKVVMFLSILAHHSKNRCVKFQFKRSGQTISKEFHSVLRSVLKLHNLLLVKPHPVPNDSNDTRWGQFKGCLGALDGTHIDVHVPSLDKGHYRNRKGQVSVNVMAVCDMNMSFVYVLTGWEGSAADSGVLRDALNREHRLRIQRGTYYLCDNGYPNCEGFLTPYKGVRYHLSEWSHRRPQNAHEYYNMKHTRARNVIEHTFGLLKMRWGILRSPSWYPIKTCYQIIMACCIIHNFLRKELDVDPLEGGLDEFLSEHPVEDQDDAPDLIESLESTTKWAQWRDILAQSMFNDWNACT
ncbi:hypothetical protein ACS0TY_014318 [Phlomoides rotata]